MADSSAALVFSQLLQHPLAFLFCIIAIFLCLYLILNEILRYQARSHDFGGPPNRPLVGNLPDIVVNAPERLRTWAVKYGDVYQIQLGNVPIIVVNSAAAAKEIFGHQGHALNSRPTFYTFHKVSCAQTI